MAGETGVTGVTGETEVTGEIEEIGTAGETGKSESILEETDKTEILVQWYDTKETIVFLVIKIVSNTS